MNEIWKPVVGYEGLYEVSDLGNVRSLNWRRTGKVKNLYLKKQKHGYRQVMLSFNGKPKMVTVHRLVATAFIPNEDNLPQINHKDFDKTNNTVENLEWCTASENCKYTWENRTMQRKATNTRSIEQFSKDGTKLRFWDCCLEIKHALGYRQSSIWACCDGKRKTAYGFIWRYANSA